MSERMSEARIDLLESHNEDDGVEAQQVADLIAEVRRARASEVQKDATIKALADALEWLRAEVDMGLVTKDTAKAVGSALRLVGRLP